MYDFYPEDYSDEVVDEYGNNFTADDASDQIFREAYADIFLDSMNIRLGKQQVVWGEAERLSFVGAAVAAPVVAD